jgi:isopenicillin-N epimerase
MTDNTLSDSEPESTGLDRRSFLKLSSAAISLVAAPALVWAADADLDEELVIDPSWDDAKTFKEIKRSFALSKDHTYLNIGTTGSMPTQVLDNYNAYNRLVAERPWDMGGEWGSFPYTAEFAGRMAPQFGCNPDELVLTRNTTDGLIAVLQGLDLREGDHIVTTHHEHVAVTGPLWTLVQRLGVTVEYVEIPVLEADLVDPEDYVDVLISVAGGNPATRLLVVSHATYKTGAVLPVARICAEAAALGIVTLVDGAHCFGMLDLDLHAIDCDFYAGSGHKWQCGPGGTGILYVRDGARRLADFWPDRKPFYATLSSIPDYIPYFGLQTVLQYKGNDNYPALRALADACDFFTTIGRIRIQEWDRNLTALLRLLIRETFPDAVLYTPGMRECTGGITAFNPFSDQTDLATLNLFRDRLNAEYGFVTRTTDFKVYLNDPVDSHALRVSAHLFHDPDDIRALVQAMAELYGRM